MSDNQNQGHSNEDPPNETSRVDIRETFAGLLARLSDPTYWLSVNHTRGSSNLQMRISKLDENGTPFSIHIDVAIGGYHCQFFTFYSKGINVTASSPQLSADDPRMNFIKIEAERVTKVAEKLLQTNVVQVNRCVGKSLSYEAALQSLNQRIASIKDFVFNSTYDIVEEAFAPVEDGMDIIEDVIEQIRNQPPELAVQNIPPPDQGANVLDGAGQGDQNLVVAANGDGLAGDGPNLGNPAGDGPNVGSAARAGQGDQI